MTVSLAAIGLGQLGMHELGVYDRMPDVEIVAGADIDSASRETFAGEYAVPTYVEYEEMLAEHADELDAVNIVTPHTLHYDQAMSCLKKDLHVFLEKPLTTDVNDAQTLVSTAAEYDRTLVVGYQRHYHPAYQKIKEIVDDGRLGDIHAVNCYMGQDWIRKFTDAWRTRPTLSGGGQLYDSGSHLLDTLLWTTGTTPISVGATMDYQDHEVDVNSALLLQLERDGLPVTASLVVTADGVEDPSTYEGLVIWGSDGRLTYNRDVLTVTERGDDSVEIPIQGETDFLTLLDRKLTDFIEAVRNDHPPSVPGSYGLTVVALTEAAYKAHESQSMVEIQSILPSQVSH
ncbi:Gfo/Idh/MocA family protein [Halegenticoccus tardaugens]|uniref:Gfo/Idh/MocA family protein n=1 Tax=Halegenticoccus tardaugens TaxID=2071624 RepID=UPI00100A4822|nr:Gfo/Idh/MocA family oxidoreductase [Halegenticoccus tardaugens]